MMRKRKYFKVLLLAISSAFVLVSCLDNETDQLWTEHDQKMEEMKVKYNMTESDTLPGGDNIYIRFESEGDVDNPLRATVDDMIIIDYVGTNYNGDVFDVSIEEVAIDEDMYAEDFIYGPGRFWVAYTFIGFQKAIQYMPLNSTAIMLIPGNMWNGSYEPVVYTVTLYNVVSDIDSYNDAQIASYLDSLEIDVEDEIPEFEGIWAKNLSLLTENDSLNFGDTILLSLYGYYVETNEPFTDSIPGRRFFPIATSGDTVTFLYGTYGPDFFPQTQSVNEVVKFMEIGDSVDFLTRDEYGYGEEGFLHPYTGDYIVPSDMPLHYTIKLLDIMSATQ